ncbi:MAG: DUF433 domain-containing protein [Phycisphaerae bacterium]
MLDRIVVDAQICHGKPVVKGTRTPVSVVFGAIVAGDSFEQIAADYSIERNDVRACVTFALNEINASSFRSLAI